MPISGPEVLLYQKKDRVVTITINRPERMNSISTELLERLAIAWDQFRSDDDALVAILTGSGDKAFCTGRDLIEHAESGFPTKVPEFLPSNIWKPIIAAINGYAIAVKPMIRPIFAMLLPIIFPIDIPGLPVRTANKLTINSGREVPKATIVKPI